MIQRREFLAASAAAGLALMTSRLANAADAAGAKELIELRLYHFKTADKQKAYEEFLAQAMIPALNRLNINPVGVFTTIKGDLAKAGLAAPAGQGQDPLPHLWMVLPHKSAESFLTLPTKLAADEQYQKAGEAILNTPQNNPAFERIECSLLLGFDQCPTVNVPTKAATRVLQLRRYESHNEEKALKKIHMFNQGGEIAIFKRNGMDPVLFGQALAGTRLPNLTYMLSFESEQAQAKGWSAFGKDPDWKKISSDPFYKDTVSNITNLVLRPSAGSQI